MRRSAVAFALAAGLTLSGSAAIADVQAGLPCAATATPVRPAQYSNVVIRVETAARADVTAVAHYKTTNTTKRAVADLHGIAKPTFYISGATVGYRVVVDVTVTKGLRRGSCSTSFVPQAA